MTSVQTQVKDLIKGKTGQLVFPDEFLQLGSAEAVHMALSRLAQEKVITRLGKGIYIKPKNDPIIGQVVPSLEEIARAIAEKENVTIRPTGAYALNRLGLSTQVPMKVVFLTNGNSRSIRIGRGTLTFKKTTPKKLSAKNEKVFLVIQALQELGESNVTDEVLSRLLQILENVSTAEIRADAKYAPQFITRMLYQLADKLDNQ
ncbi:Transcriptional regulator, AbiEi antitoxin, Type IV TA system [Hydrobacter penzbergensis]|uniref:Transcriptional regulator, AbiEi antitoxin, Type IV TA system n=1 Tax=Hydrobacter penzbergensis TaxID=1235997 RepID=A0A8X8IGD1_9BACT|nr:DUF6088 family protein [Hydrobacter penzbergensis]SDX01595.1 Transcriptional regulator, AbiEi antitoxin, Type IV TA system [Hydrobacter penzbergensis]